MRAWVREHARDPVLWTDVIQLVKTVVAALVAWVLAADVLGFPQPFLAPWAALLVVHATVYRTFSRGVQQVAATVIGVLLAWAIGNTLGLDPWAIAVMIFAGLAIGSLRWLKAEATTIAATAVIVLTTGFSDNDRMLIVRLVDTAIGVGVGLFVNLLVWPPLRDVAAARAIEGIGDEIGRLLRDMAGAIREGTTETVVDGWLDRAKEIDEQVEEAWALVRQARESGRFNPRPDAREVKRPGGSHTQLLHGLEQAVADARSMARTIQHHVVNVYEWDPGFRSRFVDLLDATGAGINETDPELVLRMREDLRDLTEDLSRKQLSELHWPEYGALMVNLRNIIVSMDRVAGTDPMAIPRYEQRRRLLRR